MRESLISRDTLLITDAESGVKRRVPKLLLKCSMRQLRNELIASPDDGGLLVARYSDTNYLISSVTMLRSLAPPELRPMTDHQKMMCGCAILKCCHEQLNALRRKQLKITKDKTDNSNGRKTGELTQAYKSYADYAFSNDETCYPRCENADDFVLCSMTNDEFHFTNRKCVLRKCTDCTSIDLPGVGRSSSNQSPMIMFNTYMNQFTCSHHGIIRQKITSYFDAKGTSKKLLSYVNN